MLFRSCQTGHTDRQDGENPSGVFQLRKPPSPFPDLGLKGGFLRNRGFLKKSIFKMIKNRPKILFFSAAGEKICACGALKRVSLLFFHSKHLQNPAKTLKPPIFFRLRRAIYKKALPFFRSGTKWGAFLEIGAFLTGIPLMGKGQNATRVIIVRENTHQENP